MKKGFSIIELMVVIAIVAILAAVAIPTYDWYKRRSYVAEAQQELMNLKTVQDDYFNSFRKYAADTVLKNFYGVNIDEGKHFSISVVLAGGSASYTATAFVCLDKGGAACVSGSEFTTCTITNGADEPTCASY